MVSSQNKNQELAEDLASSLKSTTLLIQNLLGEIRDNATSLAVFNEKLESLGDNVESLSHVIRDGDGKGSMVTRLALIEKSLEDIEESFEDLYKFVSKSIDGIRLDIKANEEEEKLSEEEERKFRREKVLGRLKIVALVAPGLISAAILILKHFMP